MSEMSEKARAAAKEKVARITRADPHARVDASGYSPEGEMHADIKTGPRPVSPRQYRRGGAVAADKGPARADRKPRTTGGTTPITADTLQNADLKDANRGRPGTEFSGGMKRGGYAPGGAPGLTEESIGPDEHTPSAGAAGALQGGISPHYNKIAVDKAIAASNRSGQRIGRKEAENIHRVLRGRYEQGGRVARLLGGALSPRDRLQLQQGATIPPAQAPMRRPMGGPMMMRAAGGKAHADAAQDKKLIHDMGCTCGKCAGGPVGRKEGGKLTAKAREHIKTKNFAGPDRSYPIEDPGHARNALSRVAQHGTPEVKKEVRAKVHAKYPGIGKKAGGAVINDGTRPTGGRLARKGGGRTKKGTNVNIIIAPQGAGAAPGLPPRPMPPMPPGGAPAPVGLHQGTMPAPPPMAAGVAPPTMPMRASGGPVSDGHLAKPGKYPIDAGAGGAKGRLEKAARAARS
jgi:hypothetical protein